VQFSCTFGPSWVYLYGSTSKSAHCKSINNGYGQGNIYQGKLLIRISADEPSMYDPKTTQSITDAKPHDYKPITKEFLLFSTIFDASMISQKKISKNIHFGISVGAFGHENKIKGTSQSWVTKNYTPLKNEDGTTAGSREKNKFCRIDFGNNKPCMHLTATLPDFLFRLKHKLHVKRVLDEFNMKVKLLYNKQEFHTLYDDIKKNEQLSQELQRSIRELKNNIESAWQQATYDDASNVSELDKKLMLKREALVVGFFHLT